MFVCLFVFFFFVAYKHLFWDRGIFASNLSYHPHYEGHLMIPWKNIVIRICGKREFVERVSEHMPTNYQNIAIMIKSKRCRCGRLVKETDCNNFAPHVSCSLFGIRILTLDPLVSLTSYDNRCYGMLLSYPSLFARQLLCTLCVHHPLQSGKVSHLKWRLNSE